MPKSTNAPLLPAIPFPSSSHARKRAPVDIESKGPDEMTPRQGISGMGLEREFAPQIPWSQSFFSFSYSRNLFPGSVPNWKLQATTRDVSRASEVSFSSLCLKCTHHFKAAFCGDRSREKNDRIHSLSLFVVS